MIRRKTIVPFLTVLALAALVTYQLKPTPRFFEKQKSESIAISSGYTFGKYFWLSPQGESTFVEFSPVQRKVTVRSGILTPDQWQRLMKEWEPSQLQETDLTQTGDERIAYEEGPTVFAIRVGESDFAHAVHPYHVHDGKLSGFYQTAQTIGRELPVLTSGDGIISIPHFGLFQLAEEILPTEETATVLESARETPFKYLPQVHPAQLKGDDMDLSYLGLPFRVRYVRIIPDPGEE